MEVRDGERDGGEDIQDRGDIPEYIGRPPASTRYGPSWPPIAIGAGLAILVLLAVTWCG